MPAARTQLATSRQQLLATMVLMGINRIIVTDGRIQAKVLFDFSAKDNFRFQKSATQFDYGDQYTYTSTGQYGPNSGDGSQDDSQAGAGASYYTSGQYQNTSTPVVKLVSASQSASAADLTTKAQLSGTVEVNFKSETFPLEKMADSFQIGQIQNAAKPGQGKSPAAGGGNTTTGSSASPASTPAPATAPPAAAHA